MNDFENDASAPKGVSRRTVAKAMAWSVPVVAVAATAPIVAASPPPTPVVDFDSACGNTGATQKGCGGDKTLQVPLTLSNHSGKDVVFQITAMYTCNCGTAPTGPGDGVFEGIRGLWSTPNFAVPQNRCTTPTQSSCAGGVPNGSIVVPNGTTVANYWIESASTQASSTFSTRIEWRMLDKETCAVLFSDTNYTTTAIAPQNCSN